MMKGSEKKVFRSAIMALVPKVTRTASEVSLLVTSADANGYIADIATLLYLRHTC